MKIHLDIGISQLNKAGEELCGDTIETQSTGDSTIIVLSDGLGSGVKANILSQITARTVSTMLKKGGHVEEVIETLAHTLPICSVRKMAYSTFTILQVYEDGSAYLAEYDNPDVFRGSNSSLLSLPRQERKVEDKIIKESYFNIGNGDWLVLASDGVLHAGLGKVYNLGWGWERISMYLKDSAPRHEHALSWAEEIIKMCNNMYGGKPGDDTSIAVVKVRTPRHLTLLIGPPAYKKDDPRVVEKLLNSDGKKIVCGGTTGNIVGRHLNKEVKVDLNSITDNVPPTGTIPGIDLTTEGTLTLVYTLENLRNNVSLSEVTGKKDGASKLTERLLESDSIHFIIGTAFNPAQQTPETPAIFTYKQQILKDLIKALKAKGKNITEEYF